MTTTIKISDWSWEQLKNKKKRGQSFNDVLEELLNDKDVDYNNYCEDWRKGVKEDGEDETKKS